MGDAVDKIVEAHKELILDFLQWVEKNWTLELEEKWPNIEPPPTPDYRNGYNAALEGLTGAFDCYFEEHYT